MKRIYFGIIILLTMVSCNKGYNEGAPAKVELKTNDLGQYRLYVNKNEFFVKGAGCEFGNIETLAQNGANSFRTWRTENGKHDAMEVLNEAQKHGLMVLMGLEVARERHGFDYNNADSVAKQLAYLQGEVERLKNHPALLGWAIGNELNLGSENLKVWDAVNEISKMIHQIDPNHVTTSTLAGIGKREIDYIKVNCTDLDFISIQMYGDIVNLQTRIKDAGWEGPYMVTEWGATGHWEMPSTEWGAPIEQPSNDKSKAFINRYDLAIQADLKKCLGSYVFLWGQKQERTPTWYGMFLENGAKTETVDAMHFIWKGQWPADRCPMVDSLKIEGQPNIRNINMVAQQVFTAEVFYRNSDADSITIQWEIMPESTDLGWGGDFETRPQTLLNITGNAKMEITAPAQSGQYRLFVYVADAAGNSGTANLPFLVK